ncbi:MAG TPA: hypothetical protein H9860_07165 [Candidatus Gemmiger faecavium]|nr:hypothetical protein [Candidatus Gemmiger faecavium]
MDTLKNLALGICILCAAGGVIQIFWPDNSYKPVINTVLVLYIITSVLQMRGVGTWQVPELNWQDPNSDNTDYREYAAQLAQEASVQALQDILQEQDIDARIELQDDVCRVYLPDGTDAQQAERILEENSGTMPYEIVEGGEEP